MLRSWMVPEFIVLVPIFLLLTRYYVLKSCRNKSRGFITSYGSRHEEKWLSVWPNPPCVSRIIKLLLQSYYILDAFKMTAMTKECQHLFAAVWARPQLSGNKAWNVCGNTFAHFNHKHLRLFAKICVAKPVAYTILSVAKQACSSFIALSNS